VTASGDPYGWGWDSDGRIVVVTATDDTSTIWQEIRPLRDVVVWRGKPGRLTSATVETTAAHIDIEGLIAADKDTAYFGGHSWPWGADMAATVWRFDFASHRLTKVGGVVSLGSEQWKAGRTSESLRFPSDTGPVLGGDVAKYGLPRETHVVVRKKYPDGYVTGTVLQKVDLLRLSDMRPMRSIVVTPAEGFEVSRRLVFNADFSRYLEAVTSSSPTANRSESSERETVRIVEVDPSTSRVRAAVSHEDTAVRPLGYVGRSGAFVYLGEDATGTALFLQEPGGKKPEVVLRLRDESLPWGDDVRLLGVQYSR
jgi:YD repeat-containing protein